MFSYSDQPVLLEKGQKAEKISLKYSWVMSASYKYDKEKGVYFRFRKDEPHMERVSEEQIFAKTLLSSWLEIIPYKVILQEDKKWILWAAGVVII